MKITDQEVTFIDSMGTDLSIVNAARVSMHKQSQYMIDDYGEDFLNFGDKKLLGYLAKHKHWTPFAHCFLSFRIKAPIFVARQLYKHMIGLCIADTSLVWNEVSRRYVSDEPEFFIPKTLRSKVNDIKQGSGDVLDHEHSYTSIDLIKEVTDFSIRAYDALLLNNVCPEQARMILPQNTMTEWIWSGSLYAFFHICSLRLDTHAQKETQEVATKLNFYCKKYFPEAWDALTTHEYI